MLGDKENTTVPARGDGKEEGEWGKVGQQIQSYN